MAADSLERNARGNRRLTSPPTQSTTAATRAREPTAKATTPRSIRRTPSVRRGASPLEQRACETELQRNPQPERLKVAFFDKTASAIDLYEQSLQFDVEFHFARPVACEANVCVDRAELDRGRRSDHDCVSRVPERAMKEWDSERRVRPEIAAARRDGYGKHIVTAAGRIPSRDELQSTRRAVNQNTDRDGYVEPMVWNEWQVRLDDVSPIDRSGDAAPRCYGHKPMPAKG